VKKAAVGVLEKGTFAYFLKRLKAGIKSPALFY
jgi:hypothetical protein